MKTQATNTMVQRTPAAPKQSLAPQRQVAAPIVTYKDTNGNDLQLSTDIIKQYLVSGGNISDEEAFMYLNLCKFNGLNPFLKEAFCIKFGNSPATMVVAKDTFTKRAQHNPKFRGMKAGVVVVNRNREIENRVGEIVLNGEELVGGWADVYVDNYLEPISATVALSERCQYKDGNPSGKWATAPALMIRKCALVAALREAFPDSLGGLYSTEEMGYEEVEANTAPIPQPTAQHRDNSNAIDLEPVQEENSFDGEEAMESIFGDE